MTGMGQQAFKSPVKVIASRASRRSTIVMLLLIAGFGLSAYWCCEAPLLENEVRAALKEKPETLDDLENALRWAEMSCSVGSLERMRTVRYVPELCPREDYERVYVRSDPAFTLRVNWQAGHSWADVKEVRVLNAARSLDDAWLSWDGAPLQYHLYFDGAGRLVGWIVP